MIGTKSTVDILVPESDSQNGADLRIVSNRHQVDSLAEVLDLDGITVGLTDAAAAALRKLSGYRPSGSHPPVDPESEQQSQILQAVFDDKSLQPFFYPRVQGRVPVRISGKGISKSVSLRKFDQNVVVVPEADAVSNEVFQISQFRVRGGTATLHLSYPAEGVSAEFSLEERDGRWIVLTANVVEH